MRYLLLIFFLSPIGTIFSNQIPIKAVVFDFGGVVGRVDYSLLTEFMMDSFPISHAEAIQLLQRWGHYLKHDGNEVRFWEKYAHSLNIPLPSNWLMQFQNVQACALSAIPQTLDAIMQLKQQGYIVALLSNVTEQHAAIIRHLGFYNLFHPVLLSYEIGVRKPNPLAFKILLECLSLPPEEVLFIDDQSINVQAARSLGIRGIHFTRPEMLEEQLQNFGIYISSPNHVHFDRLKQASE